MKVESEGITVVFESRLQQYVNGVTVDYSDNWFNKGFSITGGRYSSGC